MVRTLVEDGFEADAIWLLGLLLTPTATPRVRIPFDFEQADANEGATRTDSKRSLEWTVGRPTGLFAPRKLLRKVFLPRIGELGSKVVAELAMRLRQSRMSEARFGEAWDSTLLWRARIARDPNRKWTHGFSDDLADLLVETWDALLKADAAIAMRAADRWQDWADDELFERLVLYAWVSGIDAGFDADSKPAVEFLFGPREPLWRSRSLPEAMNLLAVLHRHSDHLRAQIEEELRSHQPSPQLDDERHDEFVTRRRLELLENLQQIDLSEASQATLAELQQRFGGTTAELAQRSAAAWAAHFYSDHDGVIEVKGMPASEAAALLTACDLNSDPNGRVRITSVAHVLLTDESWRKAFISEMSYNAPPDARAMGRIWNALRAALETPADQDMLNAARCAADFAPWIEARPAPELWVGLAWVIRAIAERTLETVDVWHPVALKLLVVCETFDYDRAVQKAVEWVQRAINHPVGYLIDAYLALARRHAHQRHQAGESLEIEPHARAAFEIVLGTRGVGARYGHCLLGRSLSMLEDLDASWTRDHLLPLFDWKQGEAAQVVWSGFLHAGGPARAFAGRFDATYLVLLDHSSGFDDDCLKQLGWLVANVLWIEETSRVHFEAFVLRGPRQTRRELLSVTRLQLGAAAGDQRVAFLDKTMFPAWEKRLAEASGVDDEELFIWWRFLPACSSRFSLAVGLALRAVPLPGATNSAWGFLAEVRDSLLLEAPADAVRWLNAYLNFAPDPGTQGEGGEAEEWKRCVVALRRVQAEGLESLVDRLQKRGVSGID
jgi:hypothetical protein